MEQHKVTKFNKFLGELFSYSLSNSTKFFNSIVHVYILRVYYGNMRWDLKNENSFKCTLNTNIDKTQRLEYNVN